MRTPETSSRKIATDMKLPPWRGAGWGCSAGRAAGSGARGASQGRAGGTGRPLPFCWRSSADKSNLRGDRAGDGADAVYATLLGKYMAGMPDVITACAGMFRFGGFILRGAAK